MLRRSSKRQPVTVTGEAFGVGLQLHATDAELLELMLDCLPPAWHQAEIEPIPRTLSLMRDHGDEECYELHQDGRSLASGPAEDILEELEWNIRLHFAYNAPAHFFLHAGAVAYQGHGIVIPGASFSGKTTLTGALVRAGAVYYSDEHAVIDANGRLHPYPKPLGLRLTEGLPTQTPHTVDQLGGKSGQDAAPVRLVAVAEYRPGASWSPAELSPAQTVQVLLQHTLRGLDRPQPSLRAVHRAAQQTVGLKGDRGDADETAVRLLERLALSA